MPHYTFHEMDGLAAHIQDKMTEGASSAPPVSLMMDGVPVPLGLFWTTVLSEMILGFLKALKDISQDPSGVPIVIRR